MEPERVVEVHVERPYAEVLAFMGDPTKLPMWAAGIGAVVELSEGRWHADSPMGRIVVEFVPGNPPGVLDHTLTLESGHVMRNRAAVTPDGAGARCRYLVRQRPGTSDEEFDRDEAAVRADLESLRRVLEEG